MKDTEYRKYHNNRIYLAAIIIFLMTMLSLYVERKDYYNSHFIEYVILEMLAVIALAGIIAFRKDDVLDKRIDSMAVTCWLCFTIYTLISDILVDKQYRFAEIGIFLVLGFAGLTIIRRGNCKSFFAAGTVATKWFLPFLMLASIIFPMESRVPGRFSGPIDNPSIFALFLCSIWAVLLGCLEHQLFDKADRKTLVITYAEMIATITLMILSQSLTPIIALCIITFIWLFRIVRKKKGTTYAIKSMLALGLSCVLVLAIITVTIRCAGIGGDSRIIQKIQAADVSAFLSGRDSYWRRYLSKMNLLGHSKKPFLWDHRILPHNAIIGMMYWYGVPCVIPYILMMMMAVEKSWRLANTGIKYSAVPFYCITSFIIMSMADNVEQPFVWLPWIICYLMMAPVLVMPVEEIDALKTDR